MLATPSKTTDPDPNEPRRILLDFHLPPGASSITPELILASVSPAEAALLHRLPSVVESLALLLTALRSGVPMRVVSDLGDNKGVTYKRSKRQRGRALALVRTAMEQEPEASLTRLASVTGLSRSYVTALRKRVREGQ